MKKNLGIEQNRHIEDHWSSVFTRVENMNNSNRIHKYSTPNHQKIIIKKNRCLPKNIFAMLGKDDGIDFHLREKRIFSVAILDAVHR